MSDNVKETCPLPPAISSETLPESFKHNFEIISINDDTLPISKGKKTEWYLPPNGDILDCLLLSVWDNVVGPEAVFTWKRQEAQISNGERLQTAIKYTVSHSLHAELGKSSIRKARGHELYLVEDAGFIVCSVPFTATKAKMSFFTGHFQMEGNPQLPHSLALILSGFHLQRFKDLQPLINLYMQRFACCVRAFMHKGDYVSAVTQLSPIVEQFCSNLASLKRPSNYVYAIQEVKVKKWNELTPILDLVITSHLQTCGCTVVTGDSVAEINTMIKLLAQFLQPNERCRIRFASKYDSPPYHPGILIQGMLKSASGEVNISTEDVLCNVLPTTIVDLSQERVLRSLLLHEHLKQRQIQFKRDLIALICDQKPNYTFTDNLFQKVSEPSRLVHNFIKMVWLKESDPLQRRNMVNFFCRQLEYHALALIKLVNLGYNRQPLTRDCPRHIDKKCLMKKLDLNDEPDFLVILATAEKLQSGIYHLLMSVN